MSEQTMTASEKRALKRRETIKKAENAFGIGKGSFEPEINPLNYQLDLMKALNYYNSAFDSKDKRKWVLSFVGKQNAQLYDSLPDYMFNSVGVAIRLKTRGQPLQDKELAFIERRLSQLRETSANYNANVKKTEPTTKNVVCIQDKLKEEASFHIGEINGLIDEFILNSREFDVSEYLKTNEVKPQVIKLIPPAFKKMLAEFTLVANTKDEYWLEAYSNVKKSQLKKLIKILQSIDVACAQHVVRSKAIRKPRIKKEKPASVLASKMKYLKESQELGLKSVLPVNIVGANEVWVYNKKYKKLQVYRASNESKLSVKGTTIIGYDVATSTSKTIRKPETVKDFVGMTRKTFAVAFDQLKTKESSVNGRISEECIILKTT